MGYWKARADHQFIETFRADVAELWGFDDKRQELEEELFARGGSDRHQAASLRLDHVPGYHDVRDRIARRMSRAVRISEEVDVPQTIVSYPAPAVGGPVIEENVLETILEDYTHGRVSRRTQRDMLVRIVGAAEDRRKREFWHLVRRGGSRRSSSSRCEYLSCS